MSESEKRKCYFIQYSDDFLYDPKVQKLYGTPNTGKASIAVYLQLMLIAAKNGGFIIHDSLYSTLGEQLQPHMLYTTKEEIDSVIYYFSASNFNNKYIQIVDDIYTFIQANTMTQSKTVGAIKKSENRKRKKEKLEADNVRQLSANCPSLIRHNNNNSNSNSDSNTNTINNVKQLLSNEGITDVVADELIGKFGNEAVAEAYSYATINMPSDVRTRTGFIIDCIKKKYKLSANEKTKLSKEAEFRAESDRKKQQKENEAAAIAEAEAERNEAEKVATFEWWMTLTDRERQKNWEIVKGELNPFLQQAISGIGIPNKLADVHPTFLAVILSTLNHIRKETADEPN